MVFLITYELNNKLKDYSSLYQALKDCGSWSHYLDSTWLIYTLEKTADSIVADLKQHIDESQDYLLVTKVDLTDRGGWLPQGAWDWIRKYS